MMTGSGWTKERLMVSGIEVYVNGQDPAEPSVVPMGIFSLLEVPRVASYLHESPIPLFQPRRDIRPLDLTTVPARGAAHRLPYTAATDDMRAVSQASACSRVQQEVLESRRAYLIQVIKVNDIARERLLVMGAAMAAKDVVLHAQRAHMRGTLNKWNTDLAVEERAGMELVDELSSVRKMVDCERSRLRHILQQVTSAVAGNGSHA
ncbi:hypothetical protein EST38_g12005 [Candolleomyces aberdarensis]|uniref:Uncharacterized protein n=1 Tax=Candolleomyces aberdarensis TaxID=2316362 RepID=A0A4Q2D3G9_9AGAR|nr:hypothetical protein EST38_g12005 [Candolleomyces aberdarensis]